MGLFGFVFGIDNLTMIVGFVVLLPFGIYAGGTVIRYEPSREEPVVDVTIHPGQNWLEVHGSEEELNMADPVFSPGFYTWTFPGARYRFASGSKLWMPCNG